MSDWREGYLEAVRDFLMKSGQWVGQEHYGPGRSSWGNQDPNEYSSWGTTYGWSAYHSIEFLDEKSKKQRRSCRAVDIDMDTLRERSLYQFEGTDQTGSNEVGLEVRGTCECGQYADKWLRWTGSISDILPNLLGITVTTYYG